LQNITPAYRCQSSAHGLVDITSFTRREDDVNRVYTVRKYTSWITTKHHSSGERNRDGTKYGLTTGACRKEQIIKVQI
jgi:hypothetical protein